MSTVDEELNALHAKAEALKARWPRYGALVDWMIELLAETIDAGKDVSLPELTFDPGEIEKDFQNGKPLFDIRTIPVDIALVRKTYFSLVEKSEKKSGKKIRGLRNLLTGSESKTSQIVRESLLENSQTFSAACNDRGVDSQVVRLLLRMALRPSLRAIAEKAAAAIDFPRWSRGRCPVCGSSPAIAILGEEMEGRTLVCERCETSWAYPRLRCPFCEHETREGQDYVYAENEAGLRIDVCNRCQGHLKTLDRFFPAGVIIPALDDLATSHLNMATG
ncbi:MAG: formate dehydrogenase accessory protein FdhE [Deltaproteobacteria bacterium]|nr:formate dehydrogenase accessory protein FdhE [Deltaproteobacteria bacterium]